MLSQNRVGVSLSNNDHLRVVLKAMILTIVKLAACLCLDEFLSFKMIFLFI